MKICNLLCFPSSFPSRSFSAKNKRKSAASAFSAITDGVEASSNLRSRHQLRKAVLGYMGATKGENIVEEYCKVYLFSPGFLGSQREEPRSRCRLLFNQNIEFDSSTGSPRNVWTKICCVVRRADPKRSYTGITCVAYHIEVIRGIPRTFVDFSAHTGEISRRLVESNPEMLHTCALRYLERLHE